MKISPSDLHRDAAGNEFVRTSDDRERRVFRDEDGNRYLRRNPSTRLLAAAVGVVMLGYAAVALTGGLSLPLHLQYIGVAAWVQGSHVASLVVGLLAGAIGIGVLWVAITGRERLYVRGPRGGFDDPFDERETAPSWRFGETE